LRSSRWCLRVGAAEVGRLVAWYALALVVALVVFLLDGSVAGAQTPQPVEVTNLAVLEDGIADILGQVVLVALAAAVGSASCLALVLLGIVKVR